METENFLLPPVSNTGVTGEENNAVTRIETHVDWLQGSLLDVHQVELIEFLSQILDTGVEFFELQNHGSRWFCHLVFGPAGIRIEYGHRTGSGLMCLTLPGGFWRVIEPEKQLKVFQFLHDRDFKATRDDVNFDDYGWRLSPEIIMAHCSEIEHWYVKKFKRSTHKTYSSYSDKLKRYGSTVQFGNKGKKGGLKQVVFYDKAVESDGEINACRCELKAYDIKAQVIFEILAQSSLEEWSQHIMGFIKGAIDFFYLDEEENKVSCSWWQQIFKDVEAWTLPSKSRSNPSLSKALEYVKKQVAPTLSMLANIITYLGEPGEFEAFIYSVWFNGFDRMNTKQKLIERSIKSQFAENSGWRFG